MDRSQRNAPLMLFFHSLKPKIEGTLLPYKPCKAFVFLLFSLQEVLCPELNYFSCSDIKFQFLIKCFYGEVKLHSLIWLFSTRFVPHQLC